VRVHDGMLVPSNTVGPPTPLVLAEIAPYSLATRLETLQDQVGKDSRLAMRLSATFRFARGCASTPARYAPAPC
jgi:hypothetical protein